MTLFSSDANAAPTYSLNSTNSTLAGTSVLHSLNWTDSNLSGYIFSFDNCTGGLSNSTWISFSDTWSNVTEIINSTVGCIIRWCVYANDTFDDWNSTSCNNPFSYATSQLGYLEVNLTNPDTSGILNVIQNLTFNINATVTCRNGSCGNVFGKAMYNLSSSPDTAISITEGDKPFYVQENPANVEKSCGILNEGDSCQLNWTVNATGDVNTGWKISVIFNSSYTGIQSNNTNSATVSIIPCTQDFTLQWNSINFGLLDPSAGPNSAPGNSDNRYNITVNSGSCNLDFYIKGTDLVNTTLNSNIGIGNLTWSNSSNSYSESFNLSSDLTALKMNVTQGVSFTTWYWINVPPVYSGYYNGNIYILGVENGKGPA